MQYSSIYNTHYKERSTEWVFSLHHSSQWTQLLADKWVWTRGYEYCLSRVAQKDTWYNGLLLLNSNLSYFIESSTSLSLDISFLNQNNWQDKELKYQEIKYWRYNLNYFFVIRHFFTSNIRN